MIGFLRFIYPPEVVSKPQIRFKGKASGGLKTESATHSGG
jgi:hypothetical protein